MNLHNFVREPYFSRIRLTLSIHTWRSHPFAQRRVPRTATNIADPRAAHPEPMTGKAFTIQEVVDQVTKVGEGGAGPRLRGRQCPVHFFKVHLITEKAPFGGLSGDDLGQIPLTLVWIRTHDTAGLSPTCGG